MTLLLSMAAFALASSISPGPVNLMALNAGAQHGLWPAMRLVTGATVGFTLLLVLIGLGLHEVLARWPGLGEAIRLAGVAFLLYLAWRLAADRGELDAEAAAHRPSAVQGALMQWLNPKAWLASVAGMGAFAADGEAVQVWRFAAVYFAVCYASIACWAWAGSALRPYLQVPARVRLLNRALAALLAACALYLLWPQA